MKILHISHSDLKGGASIAAYRIHSALLAEGIHSTMFVNFKYSKDISVISPNNKLDYFLLRIRQIISKLFIKTLITNNPILHSLSLFSSNLLKKINENDADIVHLHWVQHEMLSISDITKINKPILWTIHDMWPFCGAEHISMHNRWVEGYNFNNRPVSEKGFDINRWIWQKKKRYWTKPLNLVSPSNSHAKLIKMSALMHRWPLSVIPNPIDVNFWRPLQKQSSRKKLKLSIDSQLLLFTSMTNGKNFYNKGVDIFLDLIKLINTKSKFRNLELVILGKYNKIFNEIDIPIHSFEFVNDKTILRDIYNSVDVTLITSRKESFGQVAVESNSCGVPVVAFKIGGLNDIIKHKFNGYLANPYDIHDFLSGINWFLSKKNIRKIKKDSRDRVLKKFSQKKITNDYLKLYEKLT